MQIKEFLQKVDFEKEFLEITFTDGSQIITDVFESDVPSKIEISNSEMNDFICLAQGEKREFFRPEHITHFSIKSKKKMPHFSSQK